MILLLFWCLLAPFNAFATEEDIPKDAQLNFTQLTVEYGRQSDKFDVVTEDGYILTLFHIKGNEGKSPALLMHGLFDSADSFVLRGKSSIAIALAEEGYDVWVGNVRGNKYSRRHVTLSPDNDTKKFWNFSFHEMGVYDLPATIDFVLDKTGKKKLSAIGHSQGTTIFYVLASKKPAYNNKLSVFISLAPIAYLNFMDFMSKSTLVGIGGLIDELGDEEVLKCQGSADKMIRDSCSAGELGYDICERGFVSLIAGEDNQELEPDFFRVAVSHYPAGTSRKDLDHFIQVIKSGRFAEYDYGLMNMDYYSSANTYVDGINAFWECPAYNLLNVTMPVALIVGGHDKQATISDVEHLMGLLPNVVYYHVIEKFNHADFVWARDLLVYLIPILKDLLLQFGQN